MASFHWDCGSGETYADALRVWEEPVQAAQETDKHGNVYYTYGDRYCMIPSNEYNTLLALQEETGDLLEAYKKMEDEERSEQSEMLIADLFKAIDKARITKELIRKINNDLRRNTRYSPRALRGMLDITAMQEAHELITEIINGNIDYLQCYINQYESRHEEETFMTLGMDEEHRIRIR